MTVEQFEVLSALKNIQNSRKERVRAAYSIAKFAFVSKTDDMDLVLYYEAMFEFWKSLGATVKDRNDSSLFMTRSRIARLCLLLSRRMPCEKKFFQYYPQVKLAEAIDDRHPEKTILGETRTGYGSSLYEFHWEYPIKGIGIRKDQIFVITDDQQKIPMLEWCKQKEIIVFCNRCGLEITYEVSKDCPFMKKRLKQI